MEGDTLTVSGTLTNQGKETIDDAEVDLRVGPRLSGRGEVDDAAKRKGYLPGADPAPIDDKFAVKLPALRKGISQNFTLTVPVDKLDLDASGVYQLGVSVSGRTSSSSYEQVLGIQRSYLPWQPGKSDKRTKLTFLWPLIASPHVTAQTRSDEQQTPVFTDDSLAKELAPGGRLEQMVALGSRLPVTWVIDPDLLASAAAMAGSYHVKSGESTVPGTNQAVARQWLTALEKVVEDGKVIALPFGDPDLASIAHRGKGVSGTLSHLQNASTVGATTVETILHVKPSTDFAWPVNGAVDPGIVDVATSAGAHNVIARSDSLRETGNLPYTPTSARPIGGGPPRSSPTPGSPPRSRAACSGRAPRPSRSRSSSPRPSPSTSRLRTTSAPSSWHPNGCPRPPRRSRWPAPSRPCRATAGRSRRSWWPPPR